MKLLLLKAASLYDRWRLRCHELLVRAAHLKRLNIRAGIANIFLRRFFLDGHLRIGELLREMGYAFDEEQLPEMTEFIFLHPGLLEDLRKMPGYVEEYFPGARIKLNLYIDMEGEAVLFFEIPTTFSFREAQDKEYEIDERYFQPAYKKHKGRLLTRTRLAYENVI